MSSSGDCNVMVRFDEIESDRTHYWPQRCPNPSSSLSFSIYYGSNEYQVNTIWGDACQFGTPAYWVAQCLITYGTKESSDGIPYNIGSNLIEEVVGCLLGGYGVSGELSLSAFSLLKKYGIFDKLGSISVNKIKTILSDPLYINGKKYRYRFPNQRAERIFDAIAYLLDCSPPTDPVMLRRWLLYINGIGPKTASWIVRNYTGSDQVAVIDIHIYRAMMSAGLLNDSWIVAKHYYLIEGIFLSLAKLGCICPKQLDIVIWQQMRVLNGHAAKRWEFGVPAGTVHSAVPIEVLFN